VIAQELRDLAWVAARLQAHSLEKAHHLHRVITRLRHDLRADDVRLCFCRSRVLEEERIQPEAAHRPDDLAGGRLGLPA
jgi:hypothetical protein